MSLTSKQLEEEIAAMEGRLASVKVVVEIEKDAWKKVARKGKRGSKWRSAAPSTSSRKTGDVGQIVGSSTARSDVENIDGEIVIEPIQWDSLELAQYLQSKQLSSYAQVVVYEQISGKMLLETSPSKLKNLFCELVRDKADASWKSFLRVCSELQKLQKSMESVETRRNSGSIDPSGSPNESATVAKRSRSPRKSLQSSSTVFPAISPRIPTLTASSIGGKPEAKPSGMPLHIGGDDSKRLKTPAHHSLLRKAGSTTTQQMMTCWNCGARFPKAASAALTRDNSGLSSSGSKDPLAMRVFCSRVCQEAIESSDISVSASLSIGTSVTPIAVPTMKTLDAVESQLHHPAPKPPPSLNTVIKSPRHRPPQTAVDSFDFLQVSHQGPLTDALRPQSIVLKQASGRRRLVPSSQQYQYQTGSTGGNLSPVASITAVRALPDDAIPSMLLHSVGPTHSNSRGYEMSKYRLDPAILYRRDSRWMACFDATVPISPIQKVGTTSHRILNLEKLIEYLSTKSAHYLSLTCQKWYELVHGHALTSDRVWRVLFRRTWLSTCEDEQCVRELGYTPAKMKKSRRMMMKLTRQVQRIVLENMRILLNPDNWQLAPVCNQEVDYVPLALIRRDGIPIPGAETTPVDRGNDLYEYVTLICNQTSDIIAVQCQELIRPIAEDGSTMEILDGLRAGTLLSVECRRLRLFSPVNRLPFSEWYLLPDVCTVLDICHASRKTSSSQKTPSVWQFRVLMKLQKALEKRLVNKDGVQHVMKTIQERGATQQAVDAFEQFLKRFAPALLGGTVRSRSKPPPDV